MATPQLKDQKRTALVTGASSGLGKELAALFAKDGRDVVLVARSQGKLRALADELQKAHRIRAHVVPADLSDRGAAEGLRRKLSRDRARIFAPLRRGLAWHLAVRSPQGVQSI